ncbi:MAG: NAD-dependent epimerase/dehydratase family protein [Bifidobacteriaceae bacterium]|nr:NAD-dependent epimerase/dehydratase family protein [Bifidobacteriaceae bacterium]
MLTSADSIGRALARIMPFDQVYSGNSVEQAVREDLDHLTVTALAPLAWATNRAASEDLMSIRRLQEVVATCRFDTLTLISTCTVYPVPYRVDESTPINPALLQPYARHRYDLERWCQDRWDTTVVRLPHVFGGPYRSETRNPARDLARFAALNPASTKQHYDLTRLGADLAAVQAEALPLVNLVTPPVSNGRVLTELMGVPPLPGAESIPVVARDVRTRHADRLGGAGGYLETEEAEVSRIAAYMTANAPAPAPGLEGG